MTQKGRIEAILSKVLSNIKNVRNPYNVELLDLLSNMVLQYHKFFFITTLLIPEADF